MIKHLTPYKELEEFNVHNLRQSRGVNKQL